MPASTSKMGITPPWLKRPGPKYPWASHLNKNVFPLTSKLIKNQDIDPPSGEFWLELGWKVSTNFTNNYTEDELAKLPLDETLSKSAKLEYLRSQLEKRLADKDKAAEPDGGFKAADPKGWFRLKWSISAFYSYAGDFKGAETVLRELVPDDDDDTSGSGAWQELSLNMYFQHRFQEAEKYGKKALNEIQKLLGDDSPQSLGTLRLLARIMALHGKFDEAGQYLDDVAKGVAKLKDGNKYEKYEPEEKTAYEKTVKSVDNIKKGVPGAGYEDWDGGLPKEDD